MRGARAFIGRHRRVCKGIGLLSLVLLVLAQPPAGAQSGADVFDATGPPTQVAGDSVVNKFPLSHYALDLHIASVDAGPINLPDVPKLTLFALTDIIWQATAFLTYLVIQLFTFAFSLDLLQGSEATGGRGALEPVAQAVTNFYNSTFGEPFLVCAIILCGLWGINKALLQRRTTEALQAFATSLVFAIIAMWFVFNPTGSVGFIADKSNELSSAFLSVSSSGEVVGQEKAKTDASDRLFEAHIHNPWLVLNFGGLRHCVTTASLERAKEAEEDKVDDTLVSTNVYPRTGPDRQGRARTCRDNNKYAGSYLYFEQPDKKRSNEGDEKSSYTAINTADKKKFADALPEEYKVDLDAADVVAVSIQESGGVTQRLGVAIVVFLANLGMILLVGALSIAVVLAQVLALLLLLFAPAALVIGIFPGRGHDFFRAWFIKLLTALFRKAIYSFVLALLLAAATALTAASSDLGWLMSFGLQATFYWMVFLYRKQILAAFTAATTASDSEESPRRFSELYYKTRVARGAVGLVAGAPGALAGGVANAGRGVRDTARDVGHDARSARDWATRGRRGGRDDDDSDGDGRQDDDRHRPDGGDAPPPPDDGPRRIDWSTEPPPAPPPPPVTDSPPVTTTTTGSNGRGGGEGHEPPDAAGAGAGAGAPTPVPLPGGEPEAGRDGQPGRAGERGMPGAPGSAVPGKPDTGTTPPAPIPAGGAGTGTGGGAGGGADGPRERVEGSREAVERGRAGNPPPPVTPRPAPPARRDGQGRQAGARSSSAARRSAAAAISEAQQRIGELERKRGRTAGEKQELDQLRDWMRDAKDAER
ncbi:MAG: hypothetical protein LC798_05535 [Chloroflexi bacterium]|nr:hypothetical protein [Chloroflexota bacterium]